MIPDIVFEAIDAVNTDYPGHTYHNATIIINGDHVTVYPDGETYVWPTGKLDLTENVTQEAAP